MAEIGLKDIFSKIQISRVTIGHNNLYDKTMFAVPLKLKMKIKMKIKMKM